MWIALSTPSVATRVSSPIGEPILVWVRAIGVASFVQMLTHQVDARGRQDVRSHPRGMPGIARGGDDSTRRGCLPFWAPGPRAGYPWRGRSLRMRLDERLDEARAWGRRQVTGPFMPKLAALVERAGRLLPASGWRLLLAGP